MSNTAEIQNQIDAAEAQIRQLREKLEAQKTEERRAAVSQAKALVKSHGISASELGLSAGSRGGMAKSASAAKPGKARSKVAAKYRDPATGNTWTGRGKTPNWLNAKLATGKTKADYAI